MSRFPIGGGGWAYFHVPGSNSLSAYAKTFDFVEVNSTFYEYPSMQTVRSWRKRVSADFEFTVRCHQDIAHTDEELRNINTRASKPEFEKSVLAFHGVKMYKDAARLKVFRSTGRFPMATSTVGFESLREVLSEDASFPASRESLIEKQGWKIVDLTLEKRVQAAKLLVNLPKRQYHSVEDVLTTFKTWNQFLIP